MGCYNIFLGNDIDSGFRHCKITQRRVKANYAHFVAELLTEHYPEAEKVTQVQDNLNIHC